jgi:hypothetical protein
MRVMTPRSLLGFLLIGLLAACAASAQAPAEFRLGIIGTDTSHATEFTRMFNDPAHPRHVPGARVVAAFKGGSPDLESSASRVEKYAEELRSKWNVEFVPEIKGLCGKVDAILLESVDGRVHLKQAREAAACSKPMFIDKPLSDSLEDAREIARVLQQARIPWFTSSSLRYVDFITALKSKDNKGAEVWGPGPFEPSQKLDLTWYAIHPVEMLYALMGPGCEEVTRISGADADLIVGRWKDGRIGTIRAIRPYGPYGAVVYRDKQVLQSPERTGHDYRPLLLEIVKFLRTGQAPVPVEESLEMWAFMDAAQRSKESGGKPTRLQ